MEAVTVADHLLPTPCEPAHAAHHHLPAQVIGRIRRHGTRRIAHRLHPPAGGCLPGSVALLKLAVPAALIVTGVAAASTQPAAAGSWGGDLPDDLAGGVGGLPGGTLTIGRHGHHHMVNIQEPPSLCLLLLGTLAWTGLRRLLRPMRSRPAWFRRT